MYNLVVKEALYFVLFITQSGATNSQPLVENVHFYFMKASCMPIKSICTPDPHKIIRTIDNVNFKA